MGYDMQSIHKIQSSIKAHADKTFNEGDKLIKKLENKYDKQVLELPKIAMSLGKERRKQNLVLESYQEHWIINTNKPKSIK